MERSLGNLRPDKTKPNGPSHHGKHKFTPELIRYLWVKSNQGTTSIELPLAGWSDNKNARNPKDKFFTVEISNPRYSDKNYSRLMSQFEPRTTSISSTPSTRTFLEEFIEADPGENS